jgi:hypothetical protein
MHLLPKACPPRCHGIQPHEAVDRSLALAMDQALARFVYRALEKMPSILSDKALDTNDGNERSRSGSPVVEELTEDSVTSRAESSAGGHEIDTDAHERVTFRVYGTTQDSQGERELYSNNKRGTWSTNFIWSTFQKGL